MSLLEEGFKGIGATSEEKVNESSLVEKVNELRTAVDDLIEIKKDAERAVMETIRSTVDEVDTVQRAAKKAVDDALRKKNEETEKARIAMELVANAKEKAKEHMQEVEKQKQEVQAAKAEAAAAAAAAAEVEYDYYKNVYIPFHKKLVFTQGRQKRTQKKEKEEEAIKETLKKEAVEKEIRELFDFHRQSAHLLVESLLVLVVKLNEKLEYERVEMFKERQKTAMEREFESRQTVAATEALREMEEKAKTAEETHRVELDKLDEELRTIKINDKKAREDATAALKLTVLTLQNENRNLQNEKNTYHERAEQFFRDNAPEEILNAFNDFIRKEADPNDL